MSTPILKAKLTAHDLRAVAVRAGVDPRSVQARIEGRSQRSTTAARIDQTLRELGLLAIPEMSPEPSRDA